MSAWRRGTHPVGGSRPKRWLLVAAGIIACFIPGWWRAYELRVRAARMDADIAALAAANRELLAEMDRLQRDPVYIERVARRKLGRVREGEIVVKTAPPPAGASADPSTSR